MKAAVRHCRSALKTQPAHEPEQDPIPAHSPALDPSAISHRTAGRRPPRTLYETTGCLMAQWENVTIVIWATQGTLELCEKLDEVSEPLHLEHPNGGSAIHIVAGAPLPEADVRDKLAEMTRRYADRLACVGTVLEGSGFWASTLQSFIITIHSFARRPFKAATFSSIAELTRWLPPLHGKRTSVHFTPIELERILTDLRARVR